MDERTVEELYAEIPTDWKALRACLRCSLIKSYTQVDQDSNISKSTSLIFFSFMKVVVRIVLS
jgi:hypothetical protein